MHAVVIGTGATGTRIGRQLLAHGAKELTMIGRGSLAARQATSSLGHDVNLTRWASAVLDDVDIAVIASPHDHAKYAKAALEKNIPVVSLTDSIDEVADLIALNEFAKKKSLPLVIGAGFMPGLSCLLVRHGSKQFDEVHEIKLAKYGTGGPACARHHHDALSSSAIDWRDGEWREGAGGSGRELCWFPDPIGGVDCYRAALPDTKLIHRAFPNVGRITARMAATRRDRMTSRFPMMRRPHPEGLVGGVRIEIRGIRKKTSVTDIYGAVDRPAAAAAVVAAVCAQWAHDGRFEQTGAFGLSEITTDTRPLLADLAHRGVKAVSFEGI